MIRKTFTPRFLAEAGIIAALYFALTMAGIPFSYMTPQVRISDALFVRPYFTPAAIPGLFLGCLLSNLAGSPLGPYDILFGSLATLAAAFAARWIRPKWLVPLPAVAINAFVVAGILQYYLPMLGETVLYWESALWVAAGQAIACYALGLPLLLALEKHRDKLFPKGKKAVSSEIRG
jgi:uncharacterized membrane protein